MDVYRNEKLGRGERAPHAKINYAVAAFNDNSMMAGMEYATQVRDLKQQIARCEDTLRLYRDLNMQVISTAVRRSLALRVISPRERAVSPTWTSTGMKSWAGETFFGRNLKHFMRGLRAIYSRHATLDDFCRSCGEFGRVDAGGFGKQKFGYFSVHTRI